MEFDEFIAQPGYESIAKLVASWKRVAARQKGKPRRVPLPNYYLCADEGFDFEALFGQLAGFLSEQNLMEFDGDRVVYSFFLKYSSPNDPRFESFAMLFDAIEHELTKFGHPYGGILVIDITEWVEKEATGETKFLDFLSYMSTIDERTLAIFLDRTGQGSNSDEAFAKIDLLTRVERLTMTYKDPNVGLAYLESELESYGFKINPKLRGKLRQTVDIVLHTPGAEGQESLHQLAEDIVYETYKGKSEPTGVLGLAACRRFLPDGEWTASFAKKKAKRLGLIGEE